MSYDLNIHNQIVKVEFEPTELEHQKQRAKIQESMHAERFTQFVKDLHDILPGRLASDVMVRFGLQYGDFTFNIYGKGLFTASFGYQGIPYFCGAGIGYGIAYFPNFEYAGRLHEAYVEDKSRFINEAIKFLERHAFDRGVPELWYITADTGRQQAQIIKALRERDYNESKPWINTNSSSTCNLWRKALP